MSVLLYSVSAWHHPDIVYRRPVFGSIPSLAELQARWVANVLAGQLLIPKSDEMQVEVLLCSSHVVHDSSGYVILSF